MSVDLLFSVLAPTAVVSAIAAASFRNLRRAAYALLLLMAALAGCSALLGAYIVAALQGGVVLAAVAASARASSRRAAAVGAAESDGDADALDIVEGHEVAVPADDAGAAAEDVPAGRVRAALLVLAFFVLVSRALLMTRWPLAAAAAPVGSAALPSLPPAGLPHFLLVGLALFSIGLFAGITRRSVAGVGIGVLTMMAAVVLTLVAVSHFVGGAHDGHALASLAVAAPAVVTAVCLLRGGSTRVTALPSGRTPEVLSTMLAAVTVALLAGAR